MTEGLLATRQATVFMHNQPAGWLEEICFSEQPRRCQYRFTYDPSYRGAAISLTLPFQTKAYLFDHFPPFFDGLLPEGVQLEGLLRLVKIDHDDYFGQLLAVGRDLVGAVTIRAKAEDCDV